MTLTPICVVIAAMLLLLYTNNFFRRGRSFYRCGICGTKNGKHSKGCPWKR